MASNAEQTVALSHLWDVTGQGMAAMLRDGPGFAATTSPAHWMLIGAEARALFNWLVIHTTSPENESRLRDGVAEFRVQRVPAVVLLTEALAESVAPVARELGLEPLHSVPLMLLHPNQPP